MKLFLLMVKNLRRNLLRTILTGLGAFVLVTIVTVIWTVLFTLRLAMTERAANLKAIVSDKWRLPSRMPYAYAGELEAGAARQPDDVKPIGSMTWTFFGGTLDLSKKSFRDGIFGFAMEPKKCRTMMDDLDS
ncbi:MAG TPA: ABC transporter permease, partial [Planctomycetia bacterium]|nr:ABC transporter permease [Planctomycetia bacterium]